MTERITHHSIAFAHPVRLAGIDEVVPPGTYDIETIEELFESLSSMVWRRISTSILLPAPHISAGATQLTLIDPADLAAAVKLDAEMSHGGRQV